MMSEGTKPAPKPGDLLAEQAAGLAAASGGALGAAVGGLMAAKEILASGGTEGSMGQYLIASGGPRTNDGATANAMLSAVSKLAGLKSRM
jgi:hypothetical protein